MIASPASNALPFSTSAAIGLTPGEDNSRHHAMHISRKSFSTCQGSASTLDPLRVPPHDAVQDRNLLVVLLVGTNDSAHLDNPELLEGIGDRTEGTRRSLKDEIVSVHHHRHIVNLAANATRRCLTKDEAKTT